ncbi:AI-2E family transporter [Fodinisporobacter ferrooxydans]|uniref:AI-2E family transporter n=1 Tax=Fodinisporobacter ferrooxydans TaxID=2901836 RepID=A0ABY4CEW5_9BACL|nr:AI-2E family transporter [Alicyclobacillaceae bacterium MYW30-H2]
MDRFLNTNRLLRYALLILVILGCLYLIGQMRSFFADIWMVLKAILAPLLISIIFAYVLKPIVELLVRRNVPRSVAIIMIYVFFLLIVAIVLINIIPMFIAQAKDLMQSLPSIIAQFDHWLDQLTERTKYLPDSVRQGIEKNLNAAEQSTTSAISKLLGYIGSTLGQLLSALAIPFLVYYLLKDMKMIERMLIHCFPKRSRTEVVACLQGIDEALGSYVRGQFFVMFLVGTLTFIGLLIVHMPFAFLLSFIVSITNIIPYVGPLIGMAPGLILAITISPAMAFKVLIVNLIVQQLEGNVISPMIVGRSLHIHPMVIMLALLLAGEIAGVAGLVFAVPIVAVLKVIIEHIRMYYHAKS